MAQLTARTSTIFIATGDDTRVYRSVDEIPSVLRRRLLESTSGMNSATILIADRRGRQELARALQGNSTNVRRRVVETLRAQQIGECVTPPKSSGLRSLRNWLELLLPVAVGASLWFLIESHF